MIMMIKMMMMIKTMMIKTMLQRHRGHLHLSNPVLLEPGGGIHRHASTHSFESDTGQCSPKCPQLETAAATMHSYPFMVTQQRNATTQRNATQRNATQRNATQHSNFTTQRNVPRQQLQGKARQKNSNLLKAAARLATQDAGRPSRHPKAPGINYVLAIQWSRFVECEKGLIFEDEVKEASKWSCAGDLLLC
eukprot:CAMPEP_0168741106 /NCGR_PEP_ID=MMETSP0724-20121128/12332_1 /TAXON_ID=265536 /ORGANISM="Amphiprora sp., Strain CCMP467" /LENGTH=191 /DNA_ID=CAMNT_0008788579 /DNA_START=334 /DNA_END=906 /DNA_ORIENTATION=+